MFFWFVSYLQSHEASEREGRDDAEMGGLFEWFERVSSWFPAFRRLINPGFLVGWGLSITFLRGVL